MARNLKGVTSLVFLTAALLSFILELAQGNPTSFTNELKDGLSWRIGGGREALVHEFPYMAYIETYSLEEKGWQHVCGGSIITKHHVLTAGHCLYIEIYHSKIVVGNHDKRKPLESTQELQIADSIRHSKFFENNTYFQYDIGILTTRQAIEFNEVVKPICILSGLTNLVGKELRVAGWGRYSEMHNRTSDFLRTTDLEVVPLTKCIELCGPEHVTGYCYLNEETQLCTYKRGQFTGKGDSGSPLVLVDQNSQSFLQVGLVSFGDNKTHESPSVEVRVSYFIPWINEKISENGFTEQVCIVEEKELETKIFRL